MNDLHHPCEPWAERISLAAAGCLSSDEEREVRRHIETCPACRERLRQLTELCGALAEAQLPADDTAAAIVERVMSAVAVGCERSRRISHSERSEESDAESPSNEILRCAQNDSVRTRAEMIHPTVLSRSLDTWRWIMRSPISRVAATAVLVLALLGIGLWFHAGGASPAFADVAQRLVELTAAKFKVITKVEGRMPDDGRARLTSQTDSQDRAVTVVWATPDRVRTEVKTGDKLQSITIKDYEKGKQIYLIPEKKLADLTEFVNDPTSYFAQIREQLRTATNDSHVKSLGNKVIAGRRAVGYRIQGHTGAPVFSPVQTDIWADPDSLLPVHVERSVQLSDNAVSKLILSEFEFNVKPDESLLSVEPSADYTVRFSLADFSKSTEKDLVEMFHQWSELNGGFLPVSLERKTTDPVLERYEVILHPGERLTEQQRQGQRTQLKLHRGLAFAIVQAMLVPNSDVHYAGKGVSLNAADRPIFWYRPKDAKKYRVIYADLSVRDADTPPNVPDAQPVPAAAKQK